VSQIPLHHIGEQDAQLRTASWKRIRSVGVVGPNDSPSHDRETTSESLQIWAVEWNGFELPRRNLEALSLEFSSAQPSFIITDAVVALMYRVYHSKPGS
jgi:hypothetical protein